MTHKKPVDQSGWHGLFVDHIWPSLYRPSWPASAATLKLQRLVHTGDYLRRGNIGATLVCNMVLIDSPDGTNVYGSKNGKFEGKGSV